MPRMGSLELILAGAPRSYSEAEKLALADTKNEHYKTLIAEMSPADLLPGAVAALDWCRAQGLKVGLASVSKNAFTVLESLGITDKFDYVVDAATIARGKPDPEIFLRAASELGVDPADCVGVEDAVAGVTAIKAAGMPSAQPQNFRIGPRTTAIATLSILVNNKYYRGSRKEDSERQEHRGIYAFKLGDAAGFGAGDGFAGIPDA